MDDDPGVNDNYIDDVELLDVVVIGDENKDCVFHISDSSTASHLLPLDSSKDRNFPSTNCAKPSHPELHTPCGISRGVVLNYCLLGLMKCHQNGQRVVFETKL